MRRIIADSAGKIFFGAFILLAIAGLLIIPAYPGDQGTPGKVIWKYEGQPVQGYGHGEIPGDMVPWGASSPAVWNGRVYFGGNDALLYCFDAGTGKMIWKFGSSYYDPVGTPPIIYNGRVYFYSHCLDAMTGKEYWYCKGGGGNVPALYKNKVYNSGDKMYCHDAKSGKLIWEYEDSMRDYFKKSPTVYRDKVYSMTDNTIYCFDAGKGKVLWSQSLGWIVEARLSMDFPAVYDGKVFIGTEAGVIYCLNAETGGILWSFNGNEGQREKGDSAIRSSAVSKGRVVFSDGDHLFCLDTDTGCLLWTFEGRVSPPSISNGKIYIYASFNPDPDFYMESMYKDGIYCLDLNSGEVLWSRDVSIGTVYAPIIHGGRLYIGATCIDAGDPKAGGWTMFGGGPELGGYNRLEKQPLQY